MRSDAARNRQKLLTAAAEEFTLRGSDASLEAIAKRAGVGIGTLYRHFPTRDALVAAAYEAEVEDLRATADVLLADVDADDVRGMLYAVWQVTDADRARRMLRVLMDGLRVVRSDEVPLT